MYIRHIRVLVITILFILFFVSAAMCAKQSDLSLSRLNRMKQVSKSSSKESLRGNNSRLSATGNIGQGSAGNFFGESGREGWFWYEDPVKKKKEPKKEQRTINKTKKKPKHKKDKKAEKVAVGTHKKKGERNYPSLMKMPDHKFKGNIDWDSVWNMHPDVFQDLIKKTRKWAVQKPSKDRVLKYYALQWVAQERSEEFQQTFDRVRLQNPSLDSSVKRAPTKLGSRYEIYQKKHDRKKAMRRMRKDMGLILFVGSDCPYCRKEKDILKSFVDQKNWKNYEIVDIRNRPEMADDYGVQVLPDLWVVGNVGGKIKKMRIKSGLAEFYHILDGVTKAHARWFKGERYNGPNMTKDVVEFNEVVDKIMKKEK